MNAKQRRKEKRAEVRHNPKHVGRPEKIGVERGYGPRHAGNSKEGQDLTKIDTDNVPALLTPREAVLNRNAAEMAGRGNIEALNEKGNQLAKSGVDLAGGGENMKSRQKLQGGDDAVARNPFPGRGPGGVYPSMPGLGTGAPPDQIGGFGGGLGARDEFGRQFSQRNAGGFYGAGHGVAPQPGGPQPGGPQPMPVTPPGGWQNLPAPLQRAGGFYPPGQGMRMQGGEEDILGGGESIYGKSAPVQLSAPGGLGDLVKAITAEAQKQGLNANQIAGILKMVQGMGGSGGGSGLTVGAGTGNMDAVGAFQGGISDIGYPPFVAPNAQFHGDKGGWVGPYDSLYMIPAYQRGTSNVPG